MRFKSKPQEVEAIQWTGENFDEVLLFAGDRVHLVQSENEEHPEPYLELLSGDDGSSGFVPVEVGKWVVHWADDTRDWWPVDDERFQAKYDPV